MKINKDSVWYRWYVVTLLLFVFILSYFDRFILSLVVDPIKESMGLSDFQIGLLLGPAFSIFHVAVSIPLGLLADRWNRKWLLIAGIVIWCMMTTMTGFAMSFIPLLIFRLGLGLGEAVVSPCSVSIISDYFKRDDRARAISLYMAGPYLGAGLAFLVGGIMFSMLEEIGHVDLFGHSFAPWQMMFLVVGAPGILFALLMLTVKEPPKTDTISVSVEDQSKISAIRYMLDRWKGYSVLFIGSTCNFAMATLAFWNVPLFSRVWGWDVLTTGAVTGIFYFTAGPIGTAIALWTSKRFGKDSDLGGIYTLILGLCITVPMSALYPVMPTAELAIVGMFFAFIGKSAATAGGPAALQMITPGEIRSRSVAIFNTVITVVGPLLGPPLIGAATDWSGDPASLGIVLCGFVICVGLPTLVVMIFGFKHYRQLVREMASLTAESNNRVTEVAALVPRAVTS
ncbi:MFS transporter [Parasphingorhabdus sp. JC815]|uniref:MFS transporter n=1 Tax=Parasphingorhabdus sp. JC815 TaxID=3232140 RepID=UPI0034591D28